MSIARPCASARAPPDAGDGSSLPQGVSVAHTRVAGCESRPGDLIDSALAKLGYEPEPEVEPVVEPGPGPFESKIRPSVDALVSFVLRSAGFLTATLLLLMALSLRSSTSTARALQNLSNRTTVLEAQLSEALSARSKDSERSRVDASTHEAPAPDR